MNVHGRPVRTTIFYGLMAAALFIPLGMIFKYFVFWPTAFRMLIWTAAAGYGLLLSHWGRTRPAGVILPLLLLLSFIFVPQLRRIPTEGFLLLTAGVLAWVRSGVCFSGPLKRILGAEALVTLAGAGLISYLAPTTMASMALGLWLFFLVQSLYFIITGIGVSGRESGPGIDPFERARRQAEKLLSSLP